MKVKNWKIYKSREIKVIQYRKSNKEKVEESSYTTDFQTENFINFFSPHCNYNYEMYTILY